MAIRVELSLVAGRLADPPARIPASWTPPILVVVAGVIIHRLR